MAMTVATTSIIPAKIAPGNASFGQVAKGIETIPHQTPRRRCLMAGRSLGIGSKPALSPLGYGPLGQGRLPAVSSASLPQRGLL